MSDDTKEKAPQAKIWDVKSDRAYFFGTHITPSRPVGNHTAPIQFDRALRNAIRGMPLPKEISKTVLKLALKETFDNPPTAPLKKIIGKLPPAHISACINLLKIDDLPEPKARQPSLTPIMAEIAPPPPQYDTTKPHTSIGAWHYQPDNNRLFFGNADEDKVFVPGEPFAIRAYGIMIENFPQSFTIKELVEKLQSEKENNADLDCDAELLLRRISEPKKFINRLTQSPSLHKFNPPADSDRGFLYTIAVEKRSDIPADIMDAMPKTKYGDRLVIADDLGLAWMDDTLTNQFKTQETIKLLSFLIQRQGEIVTPKQLKEAGLPSGESPIKRVAALLKETFPEIPNLGIHIEPKKGFIFHDEPEQWMAPLKIKPLTPKAASKKPRATFPKDTIQHGLWTLCPTGLDGNSEEEDIFINENGRHQQITDLSTHERILFAALIEAGAHFKTISIDDLDAILFSEHPAKNGEDVKSVVDQLRNTIKSQVRNFHGVIPPVENGHYGLLPNRQSSLGGFDPSEFRLKS